MADMTARQSRSRPAATTRSAIAPGKSTGSSNAGHLPEKPKKQAVLIIHGIGEQTPMDTLRGFVETVWSKDAALKARLPSDPGTENPIWSKPDCQCDGYELRRLTTREIGPNDEGTGRRTDFFEYYWADQMEGTTFRHVWDWLRTLLFRSPRHVPRNVMFAWIVLWLLFVLVLVGVALVVMPEYPWMENVPVLSAIRKRVDSLQIGGLIVGGAVLGLLAALANWMVRSGPVISHLGDVARYVRARPWNVSRRHAVRSRGIEMLRKLNKSARYDRIIVVGHSLGSIIGYDLINYLWAECSSELKAVAQDDRFKALRQVEKAGLSLRKGADKKKLAEYRERQRDYFAAVQPAWKISDFVTLGSPLTHADFLLAPTKEKFGEAAARREYPLCPPFFEPNTDRHDDHDPDEVFSFRPVGEKKSDPWFPHHAAVFAPVRWTNLYNRHAYLIFGDIISGPVAGRFGNGVADVEVKMDRLLFTHNSYWTWRSEYENPKMLPDHIQIIRDALNLHGDSDPIMKWVAD